MSPSITEALKAYKEERGGPWMRAALKEIDEVSGLQYAHQAEQIREALHQIHRLCAANQTLDMSPLTELAYDKLCSHGYAEVGVFILEYAKSSLGVQIDADRVRTIGHNSIVNNGDRVLRMCAERLGVKFDNQQVAERAYTCINDPSFAGRALDALMYATEALTVNAIDKSRLNIGVLEKAIAEEIESGTHGLKGRIEDAKRHLHFLHQIGIDLTPFADLKGI